MHNPFRPRLRIGLSPSRITLLHTGSPWRAAETILADVQVPVDGHSTDRWAASLRASLAETQCKELAAFIVVSDEWARYFIVTPPRQATSLDDCHAAAAMRFQMLYGEPATGWEIQADWNAVCPFLACAMPTSLIMTLTEIAKAFRLHLIWILPQFVAAWNRWHRRLSPDSWFGIVHDNHLTLGAVDQRRLCAVRSQTLTAEAVSDKTWLEAHVMREALRLDIPPPSRVEFCGIPPQGWPSAEQGNFGCRRIDTPGGISVSYGVMLARAGMAS